MTTRSRRIAHLGVQTLATKVAIYGFGVVSGALFARALGPDGRGTYYLAVTIGTVAFYVGAMGTERAQFRAWGEQSESRAPLVSAAAWLAFLLGLATIAGTYGLYELGRATTFANVDLDELAIVLVALPFQIHSLLLSGLITLDGDLPRWNRAALAGAALQSTAAVVLFSLDLVSVNWVLVLYAANIVVPWAMMLPRAHRIGQVDPRPPWRLLASQIWIGLQAQPYIVFLYLNLRLDIFLVARYLDIREVGLYSVAVALAELTWLVTDALAYSIFERQGNAGPDELMDITLRSLRMAVLLATIVVVLLAIAAPVVIHLLYGSRFGDALGATWALLPASLAMASWRVSGGALIRTARPVVSSVIAIAALVINVALNVVLIPAIGIVGASCASGASYFAGAVAAMAFLVRGRQFQLREIIPGRDEISALVAVVRDRRRLPA